MSNQRTINNLLGYYEALEHASACMVTAAQAQDWDTLEQLEHDCGSLIAQLNEAAQSMRLSSVQFRTKGRIMVQILKNDARIRQLTGSAGASSDWVFPYMNEKRNTVH